MFFVAQKQTLKTLTQKFLFLLFMLATGLSQAKIAVKDDRGMTLLLAQPPQRIISLVPSLTEMVCQLGACGRLVATDRYSNYPAQVSRLPKVGGLEDANVELIVALKPDIILLWNSARIPAQLESLGLKVIALEPKTLEDVERILQKIGLLLGGNGQEQAQLLWQDINTSIDKLAKNLPPSLQGKRVYYEVDSAFYAASETSFVGQLLTRLGVKNIVPASMGPFPQLNPEYVVRANPDVIMINQHNAQGLEKRPGWSNIEAVRQKRVCVFTPEQSDILVRPGPRIVQAAQLMVRCLEQGQRS